MKKVTKNYKKGFTLVEVMLAVAIVVLISGLFVSLIIATHESYYTTYNYNDSTDYCQMFAKMIQDKIQADRQDTSFTTGSRKYVMNASICQFCPSGSTTPVVEMPRVYARDGSVPKWVFCVSDVRFNESTGMCDIDITVVDAVHDPGTVLYTYTFGFYVPNYQENHKIKITEGSNTPYSNGGTSIDNYEIVVTRV
ncbi:prepilin-type N-terminal cleavage/methylation domain-containing protein [Oscillospiraceae bacterium]|nr:prepilin-type N-terminal cleavage/methylation domain-containing protein [Oscillospiraceae bacterium]